MLLLTGRAASQNAQHEQGETGSDEKNGGVLQEAQVVGGHVQKGQLLDLLSVYQHPASHYKAAYAKALK